MVGRSVLRSAAGTPSACFAGRMDWWYLSMFVVSRGEVGEMFMGVPVGEYCVDLRYAWCWYGAGWEGMAVAVENWVAMVALGVVVVVVVVIVVVQWTSGRQAVALECYCTGSLQGMGLIRADSGGEGPWMRRYARVQRWRLQGERSQRRAAISADSTVRLSTLGRDSCLVLE